MDGIQSYAGDMSSDEVDQYLATVDPQQRDTLESLRRTLRDLLPDAAEGLSYGVPAFRLPDGRVVAGFAAFTRHLGYYPHSEVVISRLAEQLVDYSTSAGTVRFTTDHPLSDSLVGELVRIRLEQLHASQ